MTSPSNSNPPGQDPVPPNSVADSPSAHTEEQLRAAYADLAARATAAVDPAAGPPALERSNLGSSRFTDGPGRPLLILAAAGLAVIAASAFLFTRSDDLQSIDTAPAGDGQATTAPPDGSDQPGPTDGTTDSDGTDGTGTDGTGTDGTGNGDGIAGGDRYRVDTARVAADADDPFLNVRTTPEPGGTLLAKLPPTYTGLVVTDEAESADGGRWYEVELLDPVAVTTTDPGTGRPPRGWVNAAFVQALPQGLPVTLDEVPACAGTGQGDDPTATAPVDAYVYGLESSMVTDTCLRVVVTFGAGTAPFLWSDVAPGTGPGDFAIGWAFMSGGSGVQIDLGPWLREAWPDALDPTNGVYLVREVDGALDLVTFRPGTETVTLLPGRGIAVIDLEVGDQPPTGVSVALSTRSPSVAAGSVTATGVARPFEANLGVSIEDEAGRAVEAVFAGSVPLGTQRTTEYAVQTTDWVSAWGRFAVRAEGLEPGRYTLVLDATGGADDPSPLRVPFVITEAGPAPLPTPVQADTAVAAELLWAAQGQRDLSQLPLADRVDLLLGPTVFAQRDATELREPANWRSPETEFAQAVEEFSALDTLARAGAVRFTAGPIPFCAGPPRDWPSELDGLRQVSIEPVGVDSCIAWFGVSLFLDDDDRIAAVALDRFGP